MSCIQLFQPVHPICEQIKVSHLVGVFSVWVYLFDADDDGDDVDGGGDDA
jgi:hypothetical protein